MCAPQLGAAGNMALDAGLLARAAASQEPFPLVRIYRWERPTLSVGRHQRLDPAVAARCSEAGVAVVRRPTGGTAVLHNGDVTYSVVAPCGTRSVLEAYRWAGEALVRAFDRLGLDAGIARHHGPGTRSAACFEAMVGADLEVGGRKVCGSAQLRRNGWFLQHGSIPVQDTRRRTSEIFGEIGGSWTCLEELRPGTAVEDLEEALKHGFNLTWGVCVERGLNPQERETLPAESDYACSTF